jgi:hypothetical protein
VKSTIKLDNMAALVVQPDGDSVSLTITVGAIAVQKKVLSLVALGGLIAALEGAGDEAQKYADALDRAAGVETRFQQQRAIVMGSRHD